MLLTLLLACAATQAPPDGTTDALPDAALQPGEKGWMAFVVEDGTYLSARWPGDAYLFGRRLIARLG